MTRDISETNRTEQLDRLVSGDLDERDRRQLIAWLEEDPRRWRLCGLLFLESQTWSHALAEWPCGSPSSVAAPPPKITMSTATTRRSPIVHAAILAASVLLSFLFGFTIRGANEPNRSIAHDQLAAPGNTSLAGVNPVLAELPLRSTVRGLPQSTLQIPVVPKTATNAAQEPLPDYVRQQWERRGYQFQLERRYVFARLPGGQQVAVPIDQYSVKHVPPQIN
jgi:hypothetical protein